MVIRLRSRNPTTGFVKRVPVLVPLKIGIKNFGTVKRPAFKIFVPSETGI